MSNNTNTKIVWKPLGTKKGRYGALQSADGRFTVSYYKGTPAMGSRRTGGVIPAERGRWQASDRVRLSGDGIDKGADGCFLAHPEWHGASSPSFPTKAEAKAWCDGRYND